MIKISPVHVPIKPTRQEAGAKGILGLLACWLLGVKDAVGEVAT